MITTKKIRHRNNHADQSHFHEMDEHSVSAFTAAHVWMLAKVILL